MAQPLQNSPSPEARLSAEPSKKQSSEAAPRRTATDPREVAAPETVEANIRTVASLEREFEERRTLADNLADTIGGFTGSLWFVSLHGVFFLFWFLVNTGVLSIIRPFDPYPFVLLCMVVSVEAVLLSTFVLMKQNRMQQRSDIRDHLNLQIDLLSEKEITKLLQLMRLVCRRLDVGEAVNDLELDELANVTSVDMLASRINSERLSSD